MKTASGKYLLVLALAIVLAVSLLVWTKPVKQPDLKAALPIHVTVIQVQKQDINPTDTVTGRFQAAQKAVLHFELAGQLVKRHVEPGQRVVAGQALLDLADGDYQDAQAEAKAALEQERAGIARDRQLLSLASRERALQGQAVDRFEQLGQQSLVSQAQRDEAQARLLQLQADEARLRYSVSTAETSLAQRETAVSRAQRNVERTRLSAPFSGIVNQVFVEAGDYVAPNTPALELLDSTLLDLYAEIPGNSAAALSLGQQVEVRSGDTTQQAKIVAVQTDPNPATDTYAVRMRMPAGNYFPGELAEATLPLTPLPAALVVPVAGVLQEEGKAYVFLVQEDVLRRTEVILGPRVQDLQVIKSGVNAGDTLVAHSIASLADGERVVAAEP